MVGVVNARLRNKQIEKPTTLVPWVHEVSPVLLFRPARRTGESTHAPGGAFPHHEFRGGERTRMLGPSRE